MLLLSQVRSTTYSRDPFYRESCVGWSAWYHDWKEWNKEVDRGHRAADCIEELRPPVHQTSSPVQRQNDRAATNGFPGRLTEDDWAEVLASHGGKCSYCGEGGRMQIEHVTPLSRGGANTIDNVVPACARCNRSKGSKLVEEWDQS